jgi:hypothetical protein
MGRGPDGGPLVPVKIGPGDFHVVAQAFVDAQDALERIRSALLTGLDNANGAAGASDGARQYQDSWAAAMDGIVNDGFHSAFDLLGAIGYGIDVSAVNHWKADQDSIPGQAGSPPPWSPVAPLRFPPDRGGMDYEDHVSCRRSDDSLTGSSVRERSGSCVRRTSL